MALYSWTESSSNSNPSIPGILNRESGIGCGLIRSAELGDSKTRKADALGEKSLHRNPARLGADRRANARRLPEKRLENGQKNSLKIEGRELFLWEVAIEEPCFATSLRFWHAWRERLARPDQRRLYRKSLQSSQSRLLFPGPNGAPLSRAALHNALRRLGFAGPPNSIGPITPEKIRAAFLVGDRL